MTHLFHLPDNHPQRFRLHNEAHARQPMALQLPGQASFLALTLDAAQKQHERTHLNALCERYNLTPPILGDNDHFAADFGEFQLRWQQHNEFSSYMFYRAEAVTEPFADPALTHVPVDWLSDLAGQVMVAIHAALLPAPENLRLEEISARYFANNPLIGSQMSGGAGIGLTDFRIHTDGFSRFLVLDRGLESRQAGRLLHRFCEIEIYRVMALLAFPMARTMIPKLNQADQALLAITSEMSQPYCNDAKLLEELIHLATEIENYYATTHYRFGAAEVYYRLVERRLADLREQRIQGIQTLGEFLLKRLEPAHNTCLNTASRLARLSERIAHAGQLLRTRVEISLERQNQGLLASMDRRAKLQLRLQETVEGLSVAAISYYIVSLIGYLAKAAQAYGWPVYPDKVIGIAIPVTLLIAALGVRHIRHTVTQIANKPQGKN